MSTRQRAWRIVRRVTGSLRWQLTISYALVTLVAALALSIASAAIQVSRGVVSVDQAGVLRILEKDAARAAPYLSATAPTSDVVRFWAAVPTVDDLAGQTSNGPVTVAVFGATGHLVAADRCTPRQYAGSSTTSCRTTAHAMAELFVASSAGRHAIASALRGVVGELPITGDVAGHGFAAASVLGAGKQPEGVLVAVFPGRIPATPQHSGLHAFLAVWRQTWPQDWLSMVFATLVLGTGIGLLLSHRLIRRLRNMAAVVRTWSRGNLEASIDLPGGSELGRLGADLNEMAGQLRTLLGTRTEIARQDERRRLHRDLHDGIKQELFATAMHLAAAKALLPPSADGAATSLEKAQGSARRAQQEVGAMLDGLPPPPLARGDFRAAVTEIARQFEEQTGIAVDVAAPSELHLDAGTDEAVIRVIQEALTNCRRHAEATSVAIKVAVGGGLLRVRVEDNGHGFPVERDSQHGLGLTFMRERMESLGGRFTIASGETGTAIDVALPTDHGEPAHD